MDEKKLLRYSMQLAMLRQLLSRRLISHEEYEQIKRRIMQDYGVISSM